MGAVEIWSFAITIVRFLGVSGRYTSQVSSQVRYEDVVAAVDGPKVAMRINNHKSCAIVEFCVLYCCCCFSHRTIRTAIAGGGMRQPRLSSTK